MKRTTKLSDGSKMIHIFEKTTKEECTMCNAMDFDGKLINLTNEEIKQLKKVKGLAAYNLKRHIASGKHWKLVDYYYNPV